MWREDAHAYILGSYMVRCVPGLVEELLNPVSGLCEGYQSPSSGSGKVVSPHEYPRASYSCRSNCMYIWEIIP